MDEIKIAIAICISNLGKTIDASNEVDTAFPRSNHLRLTIALVRSAPRSSPRSLLPATVVAELELNSVNPPPDTIEEENKKPQSLSIP